jgi:amidase
VGWFARDPETFAQVGSILLQSESRNKLPSQVLIAEDAFALLDNNVSEALQPAVQKICTLIGDHSSVRLAPTNLSEWRDQQGTLQSNEAWDTVREWIDLTNPRFSFEVTERYVLAKHISADDINSAERIKAQAKDRISELLIDGAVICLPTTVGVAPPVGQKLSERTELRLKTSQLTCIAGTTGGPQISLPLTRVGGLPVGISLLGSPGDDEMLIEIARQLSP